MNQNEPQPSFELPPVQPGGADGQAMEAPVPMPERNTQPGIPAPTGPMPDPFYTNAPVPTPPATPVAAPAPVQAVPQLADDSDLIEKEWVVKAKQIVAATKEDPYVQNKELSKFKADYLKKRYNKDIKVEGA